MSSWTIPVIGIGAQGVDSLDSRAMTALQQCSYIIGSPRQLELLAPTGIATMPWPEGFTGALHSIAHTLLADKAGVIASGDPLFHGIGNSLVRAIGIEKLRIFPAVSSLALASARLGWNQREITVSSMLTCSEGEAPRSPFPPTAHIVLSRDQHSPRLIAHALCHAGDEHRQMSILSDLDSDREQICTTTAGEISQIREDRWSTLNVCALHPICRISAKSFGLGNNDFDSDGQISSEVMRAVSVHALAPTPGATLWDIGAGSGSISVEWLRISPGGRAVCVERHPSRADTITANLARFSVQDRSEVLTMSAKDFVSHQAPSLAPAHRIFVGGAGSDSEMMQQLVSLLAPGGILVANSVTMETTEVLTALYKKYGGALQQIAPSTARPLGNFLTWQPALACTQWRYEAPQ